MAKKTYVHAVDKKTKKVSIVEITVTRAQRKSLENLIPYTKAPSKIARALWH